jgi:hypothetical protein
MKAPISNNNFGYDNSIAVVVSNNNYKYKLTSRDFREANVALKSVDSIYVLWRPWGDSPGLLPLKSGPAE